jgi:hypothetical protein
MTFREAKRRITLVTAVVGALLLALAAFAATRSFN